MKLHQLGLTQSQCTRAENRERERSTGLPLRFTDRYRRTVHTRDRQFRKHMSNDKSTLITGGIGSSGKQFARTILTSHRPRRVVVYYRDELKQYETELERGLAMTALTTDPKHRSSKYTPLDGIQKGLRS